LAQNDWLKESKTELSEHEDVCLLTPGGFANELLI
jgi:hypothetical protein